jgi:unsaturated chondroitin disaccharide hydrolase
MSDYTAIVQDGMDILTDGTRLAMNHLCKDGATGKLQRMNFWNGRYRFGEAYQPHDVGLLLGRLWLLHLYTGDDAFKRWALDILNPIKPDLVERPVTLHASGYEIYYGLVWAAEILQSDDLARHAITATNSMINALWSDKAKIFYVAADRQETNIDDIGLMLSIHWGMKHQATYRRHLIDHYDTLLRLGMVRPDGSTIQVVVFDDNHEFLHHSTWQGWEVRSTWARGQAWAMHNFTAGYEATGAQRLLDTAVQLSDWWCAKVPGDWVPHYDFDDPERARKPKDSCAAALASLALIRLCRYRPELRRRYRPVIENTLTTLVQSYLAEGGLLLHGSWGDRRWRYALHFETQPGTIRFPQEEVMPYGNYYIVEALFRELVDDWSLFKLGADNPHP